MAKIQERQAAENTPAQVLERGHIYFAYRPKVDKQVAKGLDDVRRLSMILSRAKKSYRLIIIAEKRLLAGWGDWSQVHRAGIYRSRSMKWQSSSFPRGKRMSCEFTRHTQWQTKEGR